MSVCSDVADYEWLTGDEACALLNELAVSDAPLHTAVSRLRGRVSPTRTHLLIEQVELRRRATAKFAAASRMFFTRIGLEQATDEWVARYKSQRCARSAPLADLCCGIGGDLFALAEQGAAFGVDCDPIAAHFAAVNTGATVQVVDVCQFDTANVAAWHIDPDRRATGRRTTSLEFCEPNAATIEQLLALLPHAAIKLAPAAKVPAAWASQCELEWISRNRQCRQLVAWHGDLAHTPSQHRATILPTACGLAPRTITGAPKQSLPIAAQSDRYVFDIDPAVLAAGLKGALAAEHELLALDRGPTYLTGPRSIADAALACFEVLDVLPLKPPLIAKHLRERGIGQLEIKKRGVEIEPEKLRREFKLRGDNAATLLVAPIAGRHSVIVAHRVG